MILQLDQIDTKIGSSSTQTGGTIYLQIGQRYFPEENWYDCVALVLEQWLPALQSFSHKSTDYCKLQFYDGPCYAILRRKPDGTVTVACIYDNKTVIEETAVDYSLYMKSVIKAGTKFCRLLHLQGKSNAQICTSLEKLKNETRSIL